MKTVLIRKRTSSMSCLALVLLAARRDVSRLKWEITLANQLNNGRSLSEGQKEGEICE